MTKTESLFLIPTVLADGTEDKALSPQIKEVITSLDYFFVEELRTARRFISGLKTGKVIEQLQFFELNKDTTKEAIAGYFEKIPKGKDIGILSEAGCPGIADPGALAVEYAHKLNWNVVPLVGPSSIILALMGSGLNGQSFCFHGYLPIDKEEKAKVIKVLERESKVKNQTQIFMETPYRNMKMLQEVLPLMNSETRFCIAAGLTSDKEFVKTKRIADWPKHLPDIHKMPSLFLFLAK